MANKYWSGKRLLAIISVVDALVFYEIITLIYDQIIGNKDGYVWAYMVTLILPLFGIIFALVILIKVSRYWKLLPLLGIFANLAMLYSTFLAYVFSYWQL